MADLNRLAPPSLNMLRDANGRIYFAPAQPSFRTQQQVAIPNYITQQSYSGSYVNRNNPNTVFFDQREADLYGANKAQILAHEMQHQIEGTTKQKGQAESFAVDDAWLKNAKQLNKDGRYFYELMQKRLVDPKVQERLIELGAVAANRVFDNPQKQSLRELLADLSAFETANKIDMTKDPVLKKRLFNDDTLTKLYKSTTGMSGVVIGDSDYAPYSLEAAEAWGTIPPEKSVTQQIKDFLTRRGK